MALTAHSHAPTSIPGPKGSPLEPFDNLIGRAVTLHFRQPLTHALGSYTGDYTEFTMPVACRIMDAVLVQGANTGSSGTGNAAVVANLPVAGGTNTVATLTFASSTASAVVRATALVDTYNRVEAGDKIRVTWTKASSEETMSDVYVTILPLAK
jgi:hypothetical protein